MGTLNVFYIRVCRTEFDLSGSGMKLMDFVLWNATTKKSCAYRFDRDHSYISSTAKYEVWKFLKKNRDPWDRFVLRKYRDVDDFEARSVQLYSQFKSKKAFATSRDHRIRFLMWISTDTVELIGNLRYPKPIGPIVSGGSVQHLDTAAKYSP